MTKSNEIADLISVEGIDCKGFGIIAKIVMTDTDLDAGAKSLYAYLCSYTGSGTTSFPGRDRILSSLKICKTAYYKYQKQLIDNGYIEVKRSSTYPFGNIYSIVARPPKLEKMTINENKIKNSDKLIVRGIKSFGYGTVPKAVMIDSRLDFKAKALYAYFCSFAGNGSTAFPRRSDILYHLQMSINPFQKYMQQLIKYNYIDVEQQKKQGRYASNVYYLNDMPSEEAGQMAIEERAAAQRKKVGQAADLEAHEENSSVSESLAPTTIEDDSSVNDEQAEQKPTKTDITPVDDLMEQRQIYSEIIKDNIEYDILQSRNDQQDFTYLVDIVFEIILDVVTSTKGTVRINSREMPSEVVKSKFLKLTYENIEYAIDSLLGTTKIIKNKRQYIITTLYNCDQVDFHWSNQVKHDLG